jgi:hypothetical protein
LNDDDDFARLRPLELAAKARHENQSRKVLEVLLTDLSFVPEGPLDDACKAIDEWGDRMDAAIAENLNHDSIACFISLAIKNERPIEMARIARERHAKCAPAVNWVREDWARKFSEYKSKKEFGQTYVKLVIEKFPEVKKITSRTISEDWLKEM